MNGIEALIITLIVLIHLGHLTPWLYVLIAPALLFMTIRAMVEMDYLMRTQK